MFKVSTNGVLTTLYSFGSIVTNGTSLDGYSPMGGLVQGSDGYLYGTTESGGTGDNGTVFKVSTHGALTTLYSFTADGYDGANPYAGLVQGNDGYLYGTTQSGGTNSNGTVFKISTNGVLTTLYSFGSIVDTNGGYFPEAGLVQGSDGSLYGTTIYGGTNSNGTVFKISTNGTFTSLYSFLYESPSGGLIQSSDGSLYGTTFGPDWEGFSGFTLFTISTNGTFTSLCSSFFIRPPHSTLVRGNDGNFYGTISSPSPNGWITYALFRLTPSGVLTPGAGMVLSGNTLYGSSPSGGSYGAGSVFSLFIPPLLTLIPSAANVVLMWPTNFSGFTLQSTTNLASSAAWNTNSPAPVVVNGQFTVTNSNSGTQQFFRLSQ